MDKIKFEAVDICCTKKDDLKIVSALLQDAIIPYTLFHYKKKEKNVQILLNRFCHENDQKLYEGYKRIHTMATISNVTGCHGLNITHDQKSIFLYLLGVEYKAKALLMHFANHKKIKLEIEKIQIHMQDLHEAWHTDKMPKHQLNHN